MKDFNEIYENVVKENKDELENLRRKCFHRLVQCIIITIVCFFLGIFLNIQILSNLSLILGISLAIIIYMEPAPKYRKIYKEKVVKQLIKAYDENLEFSYENGIPETTYVEGAFERFDCYHSEDLIIGNVDGHDMMLAEVHTQDESTDDEGNTSYSTIFHGLFGFSNLNKSYNGMIRVHADKGFLSKMFGDKKRIEMDSSEFEKYFDVFADDKIQAMQILTSDIMDIMLLFLEESKIKFELTIRNNKLYIRFKTGGMFEGNIMKSSVDYDTLKNIYNIINFTFDLTRLFAKVIDETEI